MSDIILKVQTRGKDTDKSLKSLRKDGQIPAVFYGNKAKPVSLLIDYLTFQKVFTEAGENTVLSLEINNKKEQVLIKDVQYHPVTDRFIHVDFLAIDVTKKITAMVPLEFIGASKAVKDDGGVLVKSIDELEVECLPTNLPKNIEVNIESLATFDDMIKVSDLSIPAEVKIFLNEDDVITTVTPPRSEEELDELDEEVKGEVEDVEGVKKEEPSVGEEGEATDSEAEPVSEKKEEGKAEEASKKDGNS